MIDESRVADRPRAANPDTARARPTSPPADAIENAPIDAPIDSPVMQRDGAGGVRSESVERGGEQLEPLFSSDLSSDLRAQWDSVQIGFVDDPQRAVRDADALVGRALKSLAQTFADERARFDGPADANDESSANTEDLRLALRRYRSFFDRLLSL